MYGEFFLIERPNGEVEKAHRLGLGDTMGRDEAWLRDFLYNHPEIIPLGDIDPAYTDARPVCTELQTGVGPVDLVLISPSGYLVLVECKLWRNIESRRKVVGQILDYGAAISKWTYSDLQQQVSSRVRGSANHPYEAAKRAMPDLREDLFIDRVTRNLQKGRFLLLVVGEGIRESVVSMRELINRNAGLGFSFGLVEVALYGLSEHDGFLAIQPRVLAKTQLIERTILLQESEDAGLLRARANPDRPLTGREPISDGLKESMREWWQPILAMHFDNPDQTPPRYYYPNNVRTPLPMNGVWLTAYRQDNQIGVMLSGSGEGLLRLREIIEPFSAELHERLPPNLRNISVASLTGSRISSVRARSDFADENAQRNWLMTTLNTYINVLGPLLKAHSSRSD